MNLEEYRHQIVLYHEFSSTIREILSKAINLSGAKIHHISCRAKDHESLRNKVQKEKYCENDQNKIEDFITDLAGCRIVFYHDSDINRFRNLGIIEANFDIDRKRSVERLPKRGEGSKAEDYYKGVHYIVRLKENRINLLEYSKFKGLWCEVQIHSALNNIFSQISHDITYKPNIGDKIGQDRLRSIDRMLCDIIDKHLMPAQLAFEKVKINHDRLLNGKDLVDSNMIDEAKIGKITDNNELYAFLERYKAIMPDYNDAEELVNEAFEICKVSMDVARTNESPTIITNWGNIRGKSYDEVVSLCLEILDILRYRIRVEDSISLLLEYSLVQTKEIQDKIKKNLENISEYKIRILKKAGLSFHTLIIEELDKLNTESKMKYSYAISVICCNLLSCETRDESSNYESFTFHRGSIHASDGFKKVRSDAVKILKETYDLIQKSSSNDKIKKCLQILEALERACWQDSQSAQNDNQYYELFNLVLENAKEVTKFYISRIPNREYKLTQRMENSLARLHYRSSGINSENTPNPEVVKTSSELKILIEEFRDTAKQDEEYVIYRDLVSGYYGFRSLDNSYWEERYQDEKKVIEGYAESVNEQNLEKWLYRVSSIIKTEEDKHLFPVQNFLITLTKKCPDLAIKILKNKSEEINDLNVNGHDNIVVLSVLFGLFENRRKDVEELIECYLEKGIYLRECISAISGDKNNLNFALLEKLLKSAQKDIQGKKESSDVLLKFIQIINHSHSLETKKEAKDFILKIIKELISNNNIGWIQQVYPNSFTGEIISDLTDPEDVKIILDGMITIGRIDYSDEEVLARLVKKYPEEVINFFANRLKREKSDNVDRYDAIPYEFYNAILKKELTKSAGILLKNARNNFEENSAMFMFRWGKLLQIVFDDLPQIFIDELVKIAQNEKEEDIDFAISILRSLTSLRDCHDIEKLKNVCKAVIENPTYQEEKFYSELSIALTSTGVVSGKYGFAEAREKRVAEMKDWENASNEKLREFYKKFSESELETARQERVRADEQEELRKYEYEAS